MLAKRFESLTISLNTHASLLGLIEREIQVQKDSIAHFESMRDELKDDEFIDKAISGRSHDIACLESLLHAFESAGDLVTLDE